MEYLTYLKICRTGGEPPFIPDSGESSNENEREYESLPNQSHLTFFIAYLDWLNYVLNQTSIPQTFSTSYGEDER